MEFNKEELYNVVNMFSIKHKVTDVTPLGNGLINTTWLVKTDSSRAYVLQMINNSIFPDVDGLMRNITIVSEKLYDKGMVSIHIKETLDGKNFVIYKNKYFRLYRYIADAVSFDSTDDLEIIEAAGRYLGKFHMAVSDINPKEITDVIPDFHNTPKRFIKFKEDVKNGNPERLKEAKEEIDFLLGFENKVGYVEQGLKEGFIVRRITHNDTKLNNYLFNETTKEAICLIDFDTIMASSALYDFGDATRYLCNKAGESEKDLTKVYFDLNLFEAYTKGYLDQGKLFLNKKELELLPYSPLLLAVELSIRFLGDYLLNDTYFKIHYPTENLDRARNQIKLVKDILSKSEKMKEIVTKYSL